MSRWLALVSLVLVFWSVSVHGQEETKEDGFIHRDFQFTFMVPPVGTNGMEFARVVNCFSINTFAGFSAGTECMEVGGFLNINKAYMRGSQIAGFANIVGLVGGAGYPSEGIQVAGFGNYMNSSFDGAHIAGFTNINPRCTRGIQASGFANIMNLSTGSLQAAGFANITRKADSTLQLAGFINIFARGRNNSQASGFVNVGEDIRGVQMAGFTNIARNVSGVQMAGFINIADSIQGIPLGFINIVNKNGYSGFEISSSDFNYFQLTYKLGTPWFYNIYSAGKPMGSINRWTMGLGLGTSIPFDPNYTLKLEAIVHQELHISEDRAPSWMHTDRLNMVNQIRAIFSRKILRQISVFLAPTFNIGIASDKGAGNPIGEDLMPYWKITPIDGTRDRVRLWFGFSGGVSL